MYQNKFLDKIFASWRRVAVCGVQVFDEGPVVLSYDMAIKVNENISAGVAASGGLSHLSDCDPSDIDSLVVGSDFQLDLSQDPLADCGLEFSNQFGVIPSFPKLWG